MTILPAYPQYFSRQEWSTPGMASHAAHVWTVALESSPDTTEHRQRIASLTNHQGKDNSFTMVHIDIIGD